MRAAQRAEPGLRYKRGRIIFISRVSSAFSSSKRLNQAGVQAVLKRGRRLCKIDFELRYLKSSSVIGLGDSKIAISVPKRLLKSSVARNRIKRLVREEFRAHRVAAAPLHMLVNYRARNEGRNTAARRALRKELASLFDLAVHRALADLPGARAE